eukprot:16432479-Heterocapsa_arctica.AAC.1
MIRPGVNRESVNLAGRYPGSPVPSRGPEACFQGGRHGWERDAGNKQVKKIRASRAARRDEIETGAGRERARPGKGIARARG